MSRIKREVPWAINVRVCIVVQYVSIINVIFINFRDKMKNSINNIFQTTYFLSSQLQYTSKYIQDVILSIEYYFLIINLCKSSKILLASISTKCVENHCSEKPSHQTIVHEYYFLWRNLSRYCKRCFTMNEERERMIVGWKIILDCEICKYIAINEFSLNID